MSGALAAAKWSRARKRGVHSLPGEAERRQQQAQPEQIAWVLPGGLRTLNTFRQILGKQLTLHVACAQQCPPVLNICTLAASKR
jgi:hypothetical protein